MASFPLPSPPVTLTSFLMTPRSFCPPPFLEVPGIIKNIRAFGCDLSLPHLQAQPHASLDYPLSRTRGKEGPSSAQQATCQCVCWAHPLLERPAAALSLPGPRISLPIETNRWAAVRAVTHMLTLAAIPHLARMTSPSEPPTCLPSLISCGALPSSTHPLKSGSAGRRPRRPL